MLHGVFAPSGALEANALLFYVGVAPVPGEEADFYADDLELIEWRLAADLPDTWYAMDWARPAGSGPITATLEGAASSAPASTTR